MGWTALILFLIVVLIVWIALIINARKYKPDFHADEHADRHTAEPESAPVAVRAEPEIELPVRTGAAATLAESTVQDVAENFEPDDLIIIEGIGPKVKSVLVKAGYPTFALLSKADTGVLKKILEEAKYAYMDPSTWPEQARLAGEGKMTELKALQESLKAGRE
jgi:large subunit ribosomal protein L21